MSKFCFIVTLLLNLSISAQKYSTVKIGMCTDLFTMVEISTKGTIKIKGKKSDWVGPTPWELGYPEELKKYMRPEISKRNLKFSLK